MRLEDGGDGLSIHVKRLLTDNNLPDMGYSDEYCCPGMIGDYEEITENVGGIADSDLMQTVNWCVDLPEGYDESVDEEVPRGLLLNNFVVSPTGL